jgi:hypothetical protein
MEIIGCIFEKPRTVREALSNARQEKRTVAASVLKVENGTGRSAASNAQTGEYPEAS